MKILILGAGAYGLALANVLSEKNEVTVHSVIKEEIIELKKSYKNEKLFPKVKLSKDIIFTNDIEEAIKNKNIIIIAIPTNYIESTIKLIKNKITDESIIIASKGINNDTLKFPYAIVKNLINTNNVSILSGPSFAIDTIKKENIILTLAGDNNELKNIFPNYVKIETTTDIIGTELCGTLKNIFAISCGILKGLKVSESTKAAFLTKIINETKNIIYNFNGKMSTILLSCGIGDIILTCTSEKSRNFTLGHLIGKNKDKNEIDDYLKNNTVEGLDALISINKIFEEKNYESQIIKLIYNIVLNNEEPNKLLEYIVK